VTIPALGASADHDPEAAHAPLRVTKVCGHVNCAVAVPAERFAPWAEFVSGVKVLAASMIARGHAAPVSATSRIVA
jgi:hypothetical protein